MILSCSLINIFSTYILKVFMGSWERSFEWRLEVSMVPLFLSFYFCSCKSSLKSLLSYNKYWILKYNLLQTSENHKTFWKILNDLLTSTVLSVFFLLVYWCLQRHLQPQKNYMWREYVADTSNVHSKPRSVLPFCKWHGKC